eukprot:GILI01004417.1.p1 GENE.GILI01004417.1~~GILI01004417.1.p1  ORF type:complete len:433 (+),score=85.15 GILI01004417.1:339-1637(+)
MGCTSSKPSDTKSPSNRFGYQGNALVQPFDPLSENGSFVNEYAAPVSVRANQQGFVPKANALDKEWQLQSSGSALPNGDRPSKIRRVNIAVDTSVANPVGTPATYFGSPFEYKPPLTAMTADSKQSYFMYAESSSAGDIKAPREDTMLAGYGPIDAFGQENLTQGDGSSSCGAPLEQSNSQRRQGLNATVGPTGSSRRLDEACLEFHNAGRSDADATDIQEERIQEALDEQREREEVTPAEAGGTLHDSQGDHPDSQHSHPLSQPHHNNPLAETIAHSSSGKLTTAGNALQSQEDLAHSPVHRNANASLVLTSRPFPLVGIDQPAPFLSKSRHESVRDWLVHVDLTKLREPVSPQSAFAPKATHYPESEEAQPTSIPDTSSSAPTLPKPFSRGSLFAFHTHARGSTEGMTDDTATDHSHPSSGQPALIAVYH